MFSFNIENKKTNKKNINHISKFCKLKLISITIEMTCTKILNRKRFSYKAMFFILNLSNLFCYSISKQYFQVDTIST